MAKVGRPSKLTEETKTRFIRALKSGAHLEVAARAADVEYATVRQWMQCGEGTHPTRKPTKEYVEFFEEVTRAIADSEMRLLTIVNKGAEQDPRNAQWLLSRRFPERWAETHRVSVQVQQGMEAGFNLFFERVMADDSIPKEIKARILSHADAITSSAEMAIAN